MKIIIKASGTKCHWTLKYAWYWMGTMILCVAWISSDSPFSKKYGKLWTHIEILSTDGIVNWKVSVI